MKKKYSLDYSIERDTDRLHAVEDILDQLETNPTNSELEQMASYILYGKDENGKNAVQRKEVTDSDKRYKNFTRMDDKAASLDEILENPMADQTALKPADKRYIYMKKTPTINRPKYDKNGKLIDAGDSDIPGMVELWERIDYLERVLAANEGKIPFDDTMSILQDSYRIYKLRHMLIELRRHQYYLKDSVKPTLHFVAIQPPKKQTINWDSDACYWITLDEWNKKIDKAFLRSTSKNLNDYETRKNPITDEIEVKWVVRHHIFDWENPNHIRALIDNYSNLYMELYEDLYSWGRTLIIDLERYVNMCNFSEVRQYILLRKIDKAKYSQIAQELQEKFEINYNETHLCTIMTKEIPEKIALAAKRYRLQLETPQKEKKQCFRCKQWFPRDTLFFGINNGRKDHFASNCKECERKKRIIQGEQTENDRRTKDSKMSKM